MTIKLKQITRENACSDTAIGRNLNTPITVCVFLVLQIWFGTEVVEIEAEQWKISASIS